MKLKGENIIGFKSSAKGTKTIQAFIPAKNEYFPDRFTQATVEELDTAIALANKAFPEYNALSYEMRAQFLDAIAEEILALGDVLVERCAAESGLAVGRIIGERGRTCGQLKMFAELLRAGWWVDARIDKAKPERQPIAKSDIRRMLIPIGPVAVFGASNFPLAFSTAGGDTASALAAGCPVIVKSHSSHLGTNEMISEAIIKAAQKTGMPEGVFSSVYLSHEDVIKLVQNPIIKAVGFTGSREVGMRLFNAAVSRPDPIPVYAEMSSVNPVILLEGALLDNGQKIAKELTASIALGAGQFCTNPGLVLMVENETGKKFLEDFAIQMSATIPATMLNKNIFKAYIDGVKYLQDAPEVALLGKASTEAMDEKLEAQPIVHTIRAADYLSNKAFSTETFGPASLVVLCKNNAELGEVLHSFEGQLTATVHATIADELAMKSLISIITQKVGRIIFGGYPTGVEVCHSMQHGGPFPATTDSRSTSVGTASIYRFVRPVAYQDFPDHLLPDPLKNDNPLKLFRLVDGNWTSEKI
jgi:NADP-dependent aldehyde dehydrogenase